MNRHFFLSLFLTLPFVALATLSTNTIVLDETAVKNLRIETEVVEESAFEQTIFALGRIEVLPGRRAVISSRIPGRAIDVMVKHDHPVEAGDPALVVESRQPGNPAPRIELTAPISGLVSTANVVPGQPIEPSDILAEILDLREVYAIARVPEHFAGKLKQGLQARISVPAVPNVSFEATLEHMGAMADATSGTVEAAFQVNNPDLLLRPGMRAEFSIVVDREEGVFSIPRAALQGDTASRFVYVKDFEIPNAFVKTPVVTGRINDRNVEILSGLFPADDVVTQGAYSLAFAGGGSVSLKEALDAAHGHSHAEDGSELSDTKTTAHADANPAQDGSTTGSFWIIISGVLFILLIAVSLKKSRRPHDA